MSHLLKFCILLSAVNCYICAPLNREYSKCLTDTSYISSPGDYKITTTNRKYLPFNENCEKSWKEPFMFVQASDTQFGMAAKWQEEAKDNFGMNREIKWSTQLVADVNSLTPRPKFLVICGDLIQAWPKEGEEIREQQRSEFKRVLSGLQVPLVCVCGNHDIGNTPNNQTIVTYKQKFGDDYFSFWANGVFFIVVNSQLLKDSSETKELAAEQDTWLDEQLEVVRTEKPKHAVVFHHIPIFMYSPDEDDDYFNLLKSMRIGYLERLHAAGVRYVFTGHYHQNAGGFFKDLEVVVTNSAGVTLGDDEPGYRIVKVLQDKIEHKYYNLGKSPREVNFSTPQTIVLEK